MTRPHATARRMRSPGRAAIALGCVALALAACRSTPPGGRIADGHEGAPGVEGFLLCPANLVIGLPAELEGGVEPVQEAIVAYLRLQGRRVDRLALPDARARWQAAIDAGKSSGKEIAFASTAQIFTRELAESRSFDALVMPSLLLHHTRVRHRKAAWDGVERRLRIVNIPHHSAGRNDNWMVQALQGVGMSSDAPVISLHVVVLSREGAQVFQGRGGLDFLQEADLDDFLETYNIDLHVRPDLLQDPEILHEGVAIAFTPYLPPLER